MNLIGFSVRNPVFSNLLMAGVIISGFLIYLSLPLETFPSVGLETVVIRTSYQGATAEDVERLITVPIEEEINDLSSIDRVNSVSSEGSSVIVVELRPGEDPARAAQDIDSRVSAIHDRLPEDSEAPVVKELEPNFPLINVSIGGDINPLVLRQHALKLRDKLRLVKGVGSLTTSGLSDPVFWVNIDPLKLRQHNISIKEVKDAIAGRNIDLPGGKLRQGDFEYLIRTRGKMRSESEILSVPLKAGKTQVLLSQVAEVKLGTEKEVTRSRINGKPAISFLINKQKDIHAIKTVERINREIEKSRAGFPEGVEVFITSDNSVYAQKRFSTMLKSGSIGLALVLIVLALFLNPRAAIICAVGIPVSFFGALVLMKFAGLTLNLISMFGMVLVIGIVVDDAVVVVENVQRYITAGVEPARAALEGTREVAVPVMATVLTNLAAFMPLLVAGGLIGKFLSIIPQVAIFALIVSLLEAFLIMPSHCAEHLKPVAREQSRKWVIAMRSVYMKGLVFCLRKRYAVMGVMMVLLFVSMAIASRMPVVIFYVRDTVEFLVRVRMPAQANLDYTEESVRKIEKIAKSEVPPHVLKNILSVVGIDSAGGDITTTGDHLATIVVEYEDYEKRSENGKEVMNRVREKVAASVAAPALTDFVIDVGPPVGKPVKVRIYGPNMDVLREIATLTEQHLSGIRGVFGVSSDLLPGKKEVNLRVDEKKAADFGLDTAKIAREVRALGDGLEAALTRVGKEEAAIKLRYRGPPSDVSSLLNTHQIKSDTGGWVSLGNVADVDIQPALLDIRRVNYNRTATVSAEVDQGIITSNKANAEVGDFLSGVIKNYPGYSFDLGGEAEDFQAALQDIIRASLIAFMLIYIILASILNSYTQPFIIMSVMPFALVGVLIGVLLRVEPFTLPAIIGTVALMGVVVNDSLVLMDFINRRKRTMRRIFAVAVAAKYRFRPIIITSLTTFGGLSTLMYQTRGETAFLAPMAIALGFGLLFGTVILLFIIPMLYILLDDARIFLSTRISRRSAADALRRAASLPSALRARPRD
ncbi:MAG: efflux RND transporter permease subunit [Thermodesulfobacteriota bacterium]